MVIVNGRFLIHRITGVERYAREILAELDKIVEPNEIEMAVPPDTTNIPKYSNIKIVCIGRFHNRLWEHISFPLYVKRKKAVSLNLCNTAPLIDPGIVCIHDMRIKARPRDFKKLFLMWYSILFYNECKRAKRIITVSEFSKKEICKYYKVNPEKIEVIPNAWQHFERVKYDENTLNRYGLKKDNYYFSLGSMDPNKNIKWIAKTANNNKEQVFVVAGAINKAVFAEALRFDFPDNMRLIGYVTDEEAKTLMRDCKAFLFPSYYEGFGIPPLEAISAGCKSVVVLDTPFSHEVYGDCLFYIDSNEYEIKTQTQKSMKEILNKYSWERVSAPILLNTIRCAKEWYISR